MKFEKLQQMAADIVITSTDMRNLRVEESNKSTADVSERGPIIREGQHSDIESVRSTLEGLQRTANLVFTCFSTSRLLQTLYTTSGISLPRPGNTNHGPCLYLISKLVYLKFEETFKCVGVEYPNKLRDSTSFAAMEKC